MIAGRRPDRPCVAGPIRWKGIRRMGLLTLQTQHGPERSLDWRWLTRIVRRILLRSQDSSLAWIFGKLAVLLIIISAPPGNHSLHSDRKSTEVDPGIMMALAWILCSKRDSILSSNTER